MTLAGWRAHVVHPPRTWCSALAVRIVSAGSNESFRSSPPDITPNANMCGEYSEYRQRCLLFWVLVCELCVLLAICMLSTWISLRSIAKLTQVPLSPNLAYSLSLFLLLSLSLFLFLSRSRSSNTTRSTLNAHDGATYTKRTTHNPRLIACHSECAWL